MMTWAKIKMAAVVCGVVVLAGGVGVVVAQRMAASAPAASVSPTTRPTTLTLDEIIKGVRVTENAIQNIHVQGFDATFETRAAGATVWSQSPRHLAGSAWYDAVPGGKARVYFSDLVSEWTGGTARWLQQSVDLSFDGTEGREVRISGGIPGQPQRRDDAALVTVDANPWLSAQLLRYASGIGFSLQYLPDVGEFAFPRRPRRSLSQFWTTEAQQGHTPKLAEETINGELTVRVSWGGPQWSNTYWLAPRKGFTLLKRQAIMSPTGVQEVEGEEVVDLREVAPGVWFPMEARVEMRDLSSPASRQAGATPAAQPGKLRMAYRAQRVTVNDPKFDDRIFSAEVPVGYTVTDARGPGRRSYVVMPDGGERLIQRGMVMPRVEVEQAKAPDERDTKQTPVPDSSVRRVSASTVQQDQSVFAWWLVVASAILVAAVVVAGVLIGAKKAGQKASDA